MKTRKLIGIILLMAMSFSTLHAFTISLLDDDHCNVSEYVQEIEQASSDTLSGDVCDIHHAFHVPFLLPHELQLSHETPKQSKHAISDLTYSFTLQNTLFQPPITLS